MSAGLEMRFYFGERDRAGDGPLDVAVMDACARHGVWAAALLRGIEGFGAGARLRTDRLLSLSEDAPLVAVAVGESAMVEALAEEVRALAGGGLMTLDEVELASTGSPTASAALEFAPTGSATPSAAVAADPVGGAPGDGGRDVVRATIWGARSGPRSPHLAAVEALHRHGADSATVLLGVDGVLDGERRRARFVAANRGVPAITVAVGERGAILAAIAGIGPSADLVTLQAAEGVEDRSRLSRAILHGARVALLTSEATQGSSGPLYLEYVQALRRAGAAGATALRGVWGFRGGVTPHGDRVLGLRRDVPVIVEAVDSAERATKWLEVAESLADGTDIVDSRPIPRILTVVD